MSECCGKNNSCDEPESSCCCGQESEPGMEERAADPFLWFEYMVENNLEYLEKAKAENRPVVGIMCEYTPREVIMAAGGVPACLCGGSNEMIPAAEEDLPANLCPLIKSTYGYHKNGVNPFLESAALIVAETTCDGKKKMFEVMGETRPMHILELTQKQDDPDAFEHWLKEIRNLKSELEKRFNTTVTDEKLEDAIAVMNRERRLRRKLGEFMKLDPPPLSGKQLLEFKSIIAGQCPDLAQYEAAIKKLENTPPSEELAGKVRVLFTGVPAPHGAEKVVNIVEDHGGLIAAMESCTGLKPVLEEIPENSGDPLRAIAEHYYNNIPCSVMTPNKRRMDTLRALAGEYKPQCIIELVWQACLTYDVESFMVKKLAAELDLPYLKIETDYSPSDAARIAVRIEALFETINRK